MKHVKLCLVHYKAENNYSKRWFREIKSVTIPELESQSQKGNKSIEIPGPSHGDTQPCNGLRC